MFCVLSPTQVAEQAVQAVPRVDQHAPPPQVVHAVEEHLHHHPVQVSLSLHGGDYISDEQLVIDDNGGKVIVISFLLPHIQGVFCPNKCFPPFHILPPPTHVPAMLPHEPAPHYPASPAHG